MAMNAMESGGNTGAKKQVARRTVDVGSTMVCIKCINPEYSKPITHNSKSNSQLLTLTLIAKPSRCIAVLRRLICCAIAFSMFIYIYILYYNFIFV